MKFSFLLFIALLFLDNLFGQVIYDYSIRASDSSAIDLYQFQGKKIMIVVLPSSQTTEDSSYLVHLDSIAVANTGLLAIMAVPSFDLGFTNNAAFTLMQWYHNSLNTGITITEAIFTHKNSLEQHALFAWLSHSSLNGHFDEDITGPGQMFIINENGALYGVLQPEARWSNGILSRILQ